MAGDRPAIAASKNNDSRAEPSRVLPQREWAKHSLAQSKTRLNASLIQRQIATELETLGRELVVSGDAYKSSKNDPDRGNGIKPLLAIKIKGNNDWRLHVHLAPDHFIRRMTGWNIKNETEGKYVYDFHLKTNMDLDAEDQKLFDVYAPKWKQRGSYPGNVNWNGRTPEEEELLRQEREERQKVELDAQREDYAKRLELKLNKYVEMETNKDEITETYTFKGKRERRKETASQYRQYIENNQGLPKALPPVVDVKINSRVGTENSQGGKENVYVVRCVYSMGKYLEKKELVKAEIERHVEEMNVVKEPTVTSNWETKAQPILTARVAHIAAVRLGTKDDEVRDYASGKF